MTPALSQAWVMGPEGQLVQPSTASWELGGGVAERLVEQALATRATSVPSTQACGQLREPPPHVRGPGPPVPLPLTAAGRCHSPAPGSSRPWSHLEPLARHAKGQLLNLSVPGLWLWPRTGLGKEAHACLPHVGGTGCPTGQASGGGGGSGLLSRAPHRSVGPQGSGLGLVAHLALMSEHRSLRVKSHDIEISAPHIPRRRLLRPMAAFTGTEQPFWESPTPDPAQACGRD